MIFPVDDFIAVFDEFADVAHQVITYEAESAKCIIGEVDAKDQCSINEWFLLTAHNLEIRKMVKAGMKTYIVTASGQTPISVSLLSPPTGHEHQNYWLGVTSYGVKYLAVLSYKAPVGIYVGGSRSMSSFRRP